jgi:hypothetical protein
VGESDESRSAWGSATVWAAVIGAISAVLSALLPWWLGSHGHEKAAATAPPAAAVSAAITPLPTDTARTVPNLTLGAWTIVESVDEAGTDFRGSTIKFKTQRATPDGMELVGWFEWRTATDGVIGQEHFIAHYEAATRQLYIEGQYVQSPTGQLAVGSFSARLSEDGRQLIEGTWGNTPSHQAGIPGSWAARR